MMHRKFETLKTCKKC